MSDSRWVLKSESANSFLMSSGFKFRRGRWFFKNSMTSGSPTIQNDEYSIWRCEHHEFRHHLTFSKSLNWGWNNASGKLYWDKWSFPLHVPAQSPLLSLPVSINVPNQDERKLTLDRMQVLVLRSKQQQISHDFRGIHQTSVKRSIKWSTCTLYHTNRNVHQGFGVLDNQTSHSLNHHPNQPTVTHRYEIQGKNKNRSYRNDSPHRIHSQHLHMYRKSL